jgi:hypothetical protein
MRPSVTPDYVTNHAPTHSKLDCKFSLRHATGRVSSADCDNLGFGEFRAWMILPALLTHGRYKTISPGISHILGVRNVFKIFKPIVRLVSVFVVHLKTIGAWAKKSSRNKAMNYSLFWHSIDREDKSQITIRVRTWAQQLMISIASYSSEIGDAINTLVPDDGLPSFLYNGFRHGGLLESSLCSGPRSASTLRRPALYQTVRSRQGNNRLQQKVVVTYRDTK